MEVLIIMNDNVNKLKRLFIDYFKREDTMNFIKQQVVETTEDIFDIDMNGKNEYRLEYKGNAYNLTIQANDNRLVVELKRVYVPNHWDKSCLTFEFVIDDVVGVQSSYYSCFASYDTIAPEILGKHRKELMTIAKKAKMRWKSMHDEDILHTLHNDDMKDSIRYIHLKMSYHQAEEFVKERITINNFIKLDIDDISYFNTIYRITDEAMIPIIEKHLKETLMLGKVYRFDTVKINRLFYVENCDIQDISECNFDHFLDMIDEYTVTDII